MTLDVPARVQQLRSEFVLALDGQGAVVQADPVGRRLGLEPGVRVPDRLDAGSRLKWDDFFARARKGSTPGWELCVEAPEGAVLVRVGGAPEDDGRVWLVGSLVPQEFEAVMGQVRQAMAEIADMHRTAAQQQRALSARNQELAELNRQLEDSSRGMRVLHHEVEEKSDSLRRMSEVKSRLVSNVSHEFRTPLNSILGLTRMLLSRVDGDLNDEQEKQLQYIRRSAESLTELVNDVLDLSKLEAGKVALRTGSFPVVELFSALRGIFKPLVPESGVELVFEDPPPELPELDTDENKISQVLKNLVSNALKFTEAGSVRVRVRSGSQPDRVIFEVQDTGIGIAPEDQERIFEEFSQVEHPIQRKVKGSGLGLSLCRRLATILGGELSVESEPEQGSTFRMEIPRVHPEVQEMDRLDQEATQLDPSRSPVLVVEDDRQTLFLYERYLRGSGFQVIPARSLEEGRRKIETLRPAAVVLDIMLDGESSWGFLRELKDKAATRDIPVLVVTVTNREHKARALGADEFCVKPMEREWLIRRLENLGRYRGVIERVLVIDDDEVSRYLVRKMLADTSYQVIEAEDVHDGVRKAQTERPHVIFLDFVLPTGTAFDVLDALKIDPRTRNIPVVIQTSKQLTEEEVQTLSRESTSVISKQSLSREVAIARIREALLQGGLGHGIEGHGIEGSGVEGRGRAEGA
jgi:signal transduction histidine kinase/CheY-like chemotaxis protein